jgi:hypothetical protein
MLSWGHCHSDFRSVLDANSKAGSKQMHEGFVLGVIDSFVSQYPATTAQRLFNGWTAFSSVFRFLTMRYFTFLPRH